MTEDIRNKILLFLAMFLTMMYVMRYFVPQPPEPAPKLNPPEIPQPQADQPVQPATSDAGEPSVEPTSPPTQPGASTASTTPQTTIKPVPQIRTNAPRIENITITTPEYEAVFSSRGGALKRFRLLNFYSTAKEKRKGEKGERLTLLDEVATGRLSFAIESILKKNIRTLDYHLVGVPAGTGGLDGLTVPVSPSNTLIFKAIIDQWEIIKEYTFAKEDLPDDHKTPFGFSLVIKFRNLANTERKLAYTLIGPAGILPDDKSNSYGRILARCASFAGTTAADIEVENQSIASLGKNTQAARQAYLVAISNYGTNSSNAREAKRELDTLTSRAISTQNITWVGLKNRFFAAVLIAPNEKLSLENPIRAYPYSPAYIAGKKRLQILRTVHPSSGESALSLTTTRIEAGKTISHSYRFYGGPLEDSAVAFNPRLERIVTYSWSALDWISRFLSKVMNFMVRLFHNYGVVVILFTVLIKTIMHPLTKKGLSSSHKMQKLQPLMKELKEKFPDDKKKQQQETMRLFAEHGVSPLGGCLPMFMQMPIFIAVYGVFAYGFSGRQAVFIPGWMDDLSQPDRLFSWTADIWGTGFLDHSFNLLPIIYLGLQMLHMNMQPPAKDPQQAQMQKMMKFMPIMIAFFFYKMPAGLVLYFVTSSLYTLMEHYFIKRKLDGEIISTRSTSGAAKVITSAGATDAPPAIAGAGAGISTSSGGGKNRKKKKKKKK